MNEGPDQRAPGPPQAPRADAASTAATELELYKLAVEIADRVSARRAIANTFFLTVNTGLVTLLGGSTSTGM